MDKINCSVSFKALGIFFILVVSFALYYFGMQLESSQYNLIGLFFLVGVIFLFRHQMAFAWIFFIYVFALLFSVFSSILVEKFSIYLIEVKAYAEPSGAGFRNAFLAVIFLSSVFLTFEFLRKSFSLRFKKVKEIESLMLKAFVFLGCSIVVYMAFVIIAYGSPLAMGVDRFTYWANIAPSGYRYASSLIPFFAFVISYSREVGVLSNRYSFVWLILAICLMILGGEKFSGLLLLIYFYFLPYFCVYDRPLSTKTILYGALFLLVSVLLVLYNYYLIYDSRFLDMFEVRLSLQGQMLFSLDKIASVKFEGLDTLYSRFFGWGSVEIEEKGIRYLMYEVAPHEVVNNYIAGGATFTAPFPANISYIFGLYLSPFIVLLMGVVSGVMGWVLVQALKDQSFLPSIIAVKAFFFVYIAIIMGESYMLFDWKMVVYSFLIIFLALISRLQVSEK